jgi:hypothetical protein
MEVLEDVLPYFLYGGHGDVVKTGVSPNFTYTYTPNSLATPENTLSITVKRNDSIFGYVGCIVGSFSFTVDNGLLVCTMGILGTDEDVETAPTLVFPDTVPFGAGQYSIQIPTATQVFDTDNFTLSINDNASHEFRLKNTGRGAQFSRFGERMVELTVERDFLDRTDYDDFKALTSQGITILASKGANNSVTFKVPAAIADTFEVTGLTGQTELIRAAIKYNGVTDTATEKSAEVVVVTQEEIV